MKIETFGEGYAWELPFDCEIQCAYPRGRPQKIDLAF
jgi:hypothetical protein